MMKQRTLTRALTVVVLSTAFALPGCSGGGNALPGTVRTKATTKAAFTIHWPQHAITAQQAGRKPMFVSPSALAVVVEVNPNAATAGPVTFANANGASTSTVTIDAPTGSDEFVFTLWDTAQTAGETQPVGNLLGQADVTQTVVAGQTNTVNATIGGVTSRIAIAPAAGQTTLQTDSAIGYDLIGDTPATFTATAYDAGNNVIIPPGAPSLTFSASGASAAYLDVEPVNGHPNQFTVQALAPKISLSPAAVTVTASDSGVPHTNTANLNVTLRSAVYVSYGSGAGSLVARYDDRGNAIPLPAGAFPGLVAPAGLAYDSKAHVLFVADTGVNKVLAFDASGNPVAAFTPPSLTGARGVAYDPQSDTIFATGSSQTIAFKADGSLVTLVGGAFSQTASPDAISYVGIDGNTSAADDEVAVGNDATNSIDLYHPDGTFLRSLALTSPAAAPITALAWNSGVWSTPVYVAGGAAGSAFAAPEALYGYMGSAVTSSTTRYGGMAFSTTMIRNTANISNLEVYLVQSDANQIQGYAIDAYGSAWLTQPDVLITTPAASGLSNPIGIATAI